MSNKWYRVLLIAISVLAVALVAFLAGGQTRKSYRLVDETMKSKIEALGGYEVSDVAQAVQEAESSRVQSMEESVAASIAESVSVMESEAASLSEVAQSIENSIAFAEAERVSIEASIEMSIAESMRAAEDESVAEAEAESQRIAESESAAALLSSIEAERASQQAELESIQKEAQVASSELAEANGETPTPSATSGLTILIGDSRTSGFEVYGLWPANQVFYMIEQVEVHYDILNQVANQNPSIVIFSNGVDDILANGTQGAINQYQAYISTFQKLSPNTRIYVQSVLPVGPAGISRFPVLQEIPNYNAMLASMCANNGWTFIDCSAGYDVSFASGDGIHFGSEWTAQWLANMRAIVGF